MDLLFLFWICLISSLAPVCTTRGFGAALPETRYEVRLELEPASMEMDLNISSTVDVYSKYGQKFRCQVPVILPVDKQAPPPSVNNSFINSALSQLNGTRCLTKTVNWWTYELCYARYILQFHLEQNERQAETLLGRFESETDWSNLTNITGERPLIHNQSYVNGSICSLTFERRRAEVHYKCEPDEDSFRIISVEELETCVYRLEVSAPTLCEHRSFSTEKRTPAEPIFCNPILPANAVTPESPVKKETPASEDHAHPHGSGRRVVNYVNIAHKQVAARANRARRIMKRRLRKFIELLVDPVPSYSPSYYTFYVQKILAGASKELLSLPFPLLFEQDDLLRWSVEVHRIHLANIIFERPFGLRTSDPDSIPPQGLAVIHSLGTFVAALIEAKIRHITEASLQPIHYTHERILDVVTVFKSVCKELERNHDPVFVRAVAEDLGKLYEEYGNTGKRSVTDLVGVSVDGITDIPIASRISVGKPWPWLFTPDSVTSLRVGLQLIRHRLFLLNQFMKATEKVHKLRGAESSFERHLKQLLSDMTSKVLVVRSVDDKADANESADDEDTDEENDEETHPSSSAPARSRSTSDMMQQLVSMINKVLSHVPSDQAQDLEVYEAGNFNGVKTFYIVSSEERGKEHRRMKQLESAYKFVDPSSNAHADKPKDTESTGSAGV
ncbi:Protein OS-9 [Clonorchis sinensis]|uniref:Protein OS-9 n=1 Tax=Clonorchis sinensis TaxID=79923 RepID=A0A8T1MIW3_CLOSI|nr:Protein OS-9 [Clonorchis sinensis]